MSENEFLRSAAAILSNVPASTSSLIVESQILTKLNEPSTYLSCQFCNNRLTSTCHLKIIPKKSIHQKMKRLVQKCIASTKICNKFEASLLKKYNKNKGNSMVITCLLCHKKNIQLSKYKVKKKRKIELDNKQSLQDLTLTKKKKRKKDPLAGLNIPAAFKKAKRSEVIQTEQPKVEVNAVANVFAQTASVKFKNGSDKSKYESSMSIASKVDKSKVNKNKNALKSVFNDKVYKGFKSNKANKLAKMLASAEAANQLEKKKKINTSSFLSSLQGLISLK